MNAKQKLVLETLREFGNGSTKHIEGHRWVCTTVQYAKVFEQLEDGSRKMTEKEFADALGALTAQKFLQGTPECVLVRLSDSVFKPEKPLQQPKENTMFDVKKATSAELVKKFNELVPSKPVKKFADRKTAERRVEQAMQEHAEMLKAQAARAQPKITMSLATGQMKVVRPAKAPKAPRAPAAPKESREDQRHVRNHVKVDGVEYKSVRAAFTELRLPIAKHIRFRGALKQAGSMAFEHNGKSYVFTVV